MCTVMIVNRVHMNTFICATIVTFFFALYPCVPLSELYGLVDVCEACVTWGLVCLYYL